MGDTIGGIVLFGFEYDGTRLSLCLSSCSCGHTHFKAGGFVYAFLDNSTPPYKCQVFSFIVI